MTVKNIIFDLGGVILDLGFERMVNSFENLGIKDLSAYFNPQKQVVFFFLGIRIRPYFSRNFL